jgi:GNAT superfamily N-acetyltransferase
VTHLLDNPVWAALTNDQEACAVGAGPARRYPNDIAPFVGVESERVNATQHVGDLVARGETVYFLGVCPELDSRWRIETRQDVFQFVVDRELAGSVGHAVDKMLADEGDVLHSLAVLAYPNFYRARTHTLGTFHGVRNEAGLVAMIGERMRVPDHQELSTLCVRPGFLRRGYGAATLLTAARAVQVAGRRLFCHTVRGNDPILTLLQGLGIVEPRAVLPMWGVQRCP